MSRPQDADRNQDATCYIGNLDDRATDPLVWELMLQVGPVLNVHLPKDRITTAHQGYGFVEYQTEADAEYSCKIMNGIKLFGKPLKVNKASSDRRQIDIGANLFVGNLDAGVDERLLYETFSAFGNIVGVPKVSRDPTTGVSKNYGFVSFDSFEASDAAIESLSNQFLLNRPITISYALKKDGKGGERHGTAAERLLASQARKNNALPPPPREVHQFAQQQYYGPPPTHQQAQTPGGVVPPPPPPPGGPPPAGMPPMQGFSGQAAQPPPPPPPGGPPMPYSGPPPSGYPPAFNGPPPAFMTGSNGAPLGSR